MQYPKHRIQQEAFLENYVQYLTKKGGRHRQVFKTVGNLLDTWDGMGNEMSAVYQFDDDSPSNSEDRDISYNFTKNSDLMRKAYANVDKISPTPENCYRILNELVVAINPLLTFSVLRRVMQNVGSIDWLMTIPFLTESEPTGNRLVGQYLV